MENCPWSQTEPPSPDAFRKPDLPWSNFTRALRRLSHNIRNHLNTAELEAALAAEITTDPEVRESLTRVRQSFGKITRELESLLARVTERAVEPVEVRGDELFRALREHTEGRLGTATPIQWDWLQPGPDDCLHVDLDLMCRVVCELLDNAIRYRSDASRSLHVRAGGTAGRFELEIVEPKTARPAMDAWGTRPFTGSDPTRFGIGLWAVGQWISAMGGKLDREYDDDRQLLVTRLAFPSRGVQGGDDGG